MPEEMDRIVNWGLPEVDPHSVAALELHEKKMFLEKLRAGYGKYTAGQSVNWSPQHTDKVMADPDMIQIVDIVENMLDEDVERGIYIAARSGNVTAGMFWVLNRRPERWKDTKKITIERSDKVSVEIVHSVKQSALELLRAAGVPALQPGGALDIVDAEVISDTG
jgi:hypothetical protein